MRARIYLIEVNVELIINTKMNDYISLLDDTRNIPYILELPKYEYIIFPEFIEWDDCILLNGRNVAALPSKFTPNAFIVDKTGFEADFNHVHLSDLLKNSEINPLILLRLSLGIIKIWESALFKQFHGTKKFMLVLSFDGEEAVLRFHTVRETEPTWVNVKHLDSSIDGVMLLEI